MTGRTKRLKVCVELSDPSALGRTETVSAFLEPEATLSRIPRSILEKLAVQPISRLPFELEDGRCFDREITCVLLTIEGKKAAVTVAFGEPGEEALLGGTALESLGFLVDPVHQKLFPRNLRMLLAGAVALAGNLGRDSTACRVSDAYERCDSRACANPRSCVDRC